MLVACARACTAETVCAASDTVACRMPAQLLPSIRNLPMDEITLIDLDLGK